MASRCSTGSNRDRNIINSISKIIYIKFPSGFNLHMSSEVLVSDLVSITLCCQPLPSDSSWFPTLLSLIRLRNHGFMGKLSNTAIQSYKVMLVSKMEVNDFWRKSSWVPARTSCCDLEYILLIKAWGAWLPPFIYTILSAWQLGSLIYASYSLSNTVSEFMV